MNVRTDFSDMHGGGDVLIAIFVHLQWNLYKLITLLQSVPDLLLTVMKGADGNAPFCSHQLRTLNPLLRHSST